MIERVKSTQLWGSVLFELGHYESQISVDIFYIFAYAPPDSADRRKKSIHAFRLRGLLFSRILQGKSSFCVDRRHCDATRLAERAAPHRNRARPVIADLSREVVMADWREFQERFFAAQSDSSQRSQTIRFLEGMSDAVSD
jgi:hypothetical protein